MSNENFPFPEKPWPEPQPPRDKVRALMDAMGAGLPDGVEGVRAAVEQYYLDVWCEAGGAMKDIGFVWVSSNKCEIVVRVQVPHLIAVHVNREESVQ